MLKEKGKDLDEERRKTYVKTMFMKSDGEEAVELSLERMKTTRSSGRHSKRSFFFLVCFNGALMFLCLVLLAFKCDGGTL